MNLDRIEQIIEKTEVGFFLTKCGKQIHGRPLVTVTLDETGSLWFFIRTDSELAAEIKNDPEVFISYNDAYSGTYLLVSGIAIEIDDKEKKKGLWHPDLSRWIGSGPASPSVTLLRVRISRASWWNAEAGRMEDESEEGVVQLIPGGKEQLGQSGVK